MTVVVFQQAYPRLGREFVYAWTNRVSLPCVGLANPPTSRRGQSWVKSNYGNVLFSLQKLVLSLNAICMNAEIFNCKAIKFVFVGVFSG